MFPVLLFAVAAVTTADGNGGPVVENCNFLPADNPCHYQEPPPAPLCWGPNGWNICEGL